MVALKGFLYTNLLHPYALYFDCVWGFVKTSVVWRLRCMLALLSLIATQNHSSCKNCIHSYHHDTILLLSSLVNGLCNHTDLISPRGIQRHWWGGDAEIVIYIIDDLHNISVFDDIITSTINIITNSTLLMFLYNTIQIIASFEIKNTLQKIILDTFTVT